MEAIPDEVKEETSSDQFNELINEVNTKAETSNQEIEELNKTLEQMEPLGKPKGFFGTTQQSAQEIRQQAVSQRPIMQQQPQRPQQPIPQQQAYQPPNPQMTQQQIDAIIQNQQRMQQQQMMEQQMMEQQLYMQQQQQMQQEAQQIKPIVVTLMLIENDKITVPLDTATVNDFLEQINGAITDGSVFKVDNIVVNCKNIKYYTIE